MKADRPPYAGRYKSRAPVPTIMVASLACEWTDLFFTKATILTLVVRRREGQSRRLQLSKALANGGVKIDSEGIRTDARDALYVDAPLAEHVIGSEEHDIV